MKGLMMLEGGVEGLYICLRMIRRKSNALADFLPEVFDSTDTIWDCWIVHEVCCRLSTGLLSISLECNTP